MHVQVGEDRGWSVVSVRGVVDVATAPDLRQRLQEVQFAGATTVLVDLDRVELLDSFGVGVLVDAHKRARSLGGQLAVLVTRERLRRVFSLAGLDVTLDLIADAEEVLGTGAADGPASEAGRDR
ncbi:MAG: STAS domain-containing protein [Nitriliruptor sp.]